MLNAKDTRSVKVAAQFGIQCGTQRRASMDLLGRTRGPVPGQGLDPTAH